MVSIHCFDLISIYYESKLLTFIISEENMLDGQAMFSVIIITPTDKKITLQVWINIEFFSFHKTKH